MKVFVYGTLKRGYGNHRLLENATLIDEAVTDVKFDMIAGGFPVVFESDTGLPLTGEVYQVDAATLQSLDNLEGEGTMYFRKEVPVSLANSHDRSVVAMYIGNPEFWSWPQPNHNDRFTKDNVLNWSR
jgi:gamma-glutamylcyclotransferase (GGCT)/AIG2-like uncharacterized protein YtfP